MNVRGIDRGFASITNIMEELRKELLHFDDQTRHSASLYRADWVARHLIAPRVRRRCLQGDKI